MRVLVVHNRYRSEQPSGENHVVDQEIDLLRSAGHDVRLFERRSDDIASMSLPAKGAVPLRVPWNPASRRDLAAELRRERPDVVHIHNTFPLLSPSVVAACQDARVPAVATLHNYGMVCPPGTLFRDGEICGECVGRQPLPALAHGCYRSSRLATAPMALSVAMNRRRWWTGISRFFCISDAQRRLLVRAGMPESRMTVKHNFIPDPGLRRSLPGEHFLFLGRMSEEKGVRVLMRAWERASTGVPLVLAGAGPLQDEVAQWAQARPDVHYLGLRGKQECQRLMANAVAVVAPSAWLEAFGLVVVEAMAADVPAVAPAHGAFVELIEHKVSGLLYHPGDAHALAEALRRAAEPARNREMGEAARVRYEKDFTPSVGLDRLLAGYDEAIRGA
ncbi:glycosyltransferase family 4 protein [Amycolatopsis sp. K13G38]|uniref:Glycosyltransferase family 4 protein n=1 Tax=Amycolatopsis acididurans TaxID=2724524 RepID=A0ABX1J7I5_9PSEU|nr:glycosyltransferase [Amycolatopsis acididurans]NKQ55752.1 glycosyltransferase family 4 protein [Amycolatopsis acididurans]